MLIRLALLTLAFAATVSRLWFGFGNISHVISIVVQLLACIGTAGWVFQRPMFFLLAWRLFFGLYLVFFAFAAIFIGWLWYAAFQPASPESETFISTIVVGLILHLPTLLGLYLYSYRSSQAWPNNSFKPNPLRGSA